MHGPKQEEEDLNRVRKYILSDAAYADLIAIADFGDENFGIKKSDEYQAKLKTRFAKIAMMPLLYPEVDEIRKNYRRSVFLSHAIYFRILDNKTVEISRIIGQQDW